MPYSATHRYGASEDAATLSIEDIERLLAELDEDEADIEHGDVFVSEDHSGWCLLAIAGDRRIVIIEDTSVGGQAWHQVDVSRADAARLFYRFVQEGSDSVRSASWVPGYGS